jgi:O-antigen ligase
VFLVFKSSKIEMSFILIFFPGIMIVQVIYSTGYGILLLLLFTGIILILEDVWKQRYKIIMSFIPLFIVLAGFVVTYIYAPKGRYSAEKTIFIIINGIAYFLFFASYIKSDKFNNLRFALFLNFIFIFLTKFGIQNYVLYSPMNFYDFGFIRYGLSVSKDSTIGFADYNSFGSLALFSVIFLLASVKKLNRLYSYLIFFSFYLALLAGARQVIYGIIAIFFIHLISNIKSGKSGQVIFYVIFSILLITILESTDIPFLSDYLLNKDVIETAGGRSEGYKEAIRIFKEKPFLGNGIGGFARNGEIMEYPHNIILEIMAEGGIFIFTLIFFAFYIAKQRSNYRLGLKTENGTLYLLLILGFAIKAFSSGDLQANFALISALLAIGIFEKVYPQIDCDISINSPPR